MLLILKPLTMKTKFTLLLLAICFSTTNYAQKVVALHSPTNGVQYFNSDTAFQEAYTAAIAGDTIYLPGGTHFPPSVFEKQLTIFGTGHYPSATSATFATKISGSVYLSDEADDFHLEGVEITLDINLQTNESINNITVKRCKFRNLNNAGDATNASVNNIFIENVFNSVNDVRNMRSSTFLNNIIEGSSASPYYPIYQYATDLSFLNNLILYSDISGTIYPPIYNGAGNCLFKNNIFLMEGNTISAGNGSSTWVNNTFCTSSTTPTIGLDPTLVNNYFMSRANVLVNQTGAVFSYDDDYHLQAGAAANLGDDGLETGIYGGFYPWKDSSIPINPHIISKTISGASDVSGNIQVDINVQAQDN